MKKYFTLLIGLLFYSFSFADPVIDTQPSNPSPWDCQSDDPDANTDFQDWLTENLDPSDGNQLEATSDCGGTLTVEAIVVSTGSSYSGSSDWEQNGCDWEIEIEFHVSDDCSSVVEVSDAIVITLTGLPPSIDSDPTDELVDCQDMDPDANTDFQTWLAENLNPADGSQMEATGLCSAISTVEAIVLSSGNPYDGTDDWNEISECHWDIEIEFVVTDECGNVSTSNSAIFEIMDMTPPTIDAIETDPAPFECNLGPEENNMEDATDVLEAILNAASVSDNCKTSFVIGNWTLNPDPLAMDPDDWATWDCNYEYVVDVFVQDDCMNQSATETITISIVDTEPPVWPDIMSPVIIDCVEDLGDPNDLQPLSLDLFDECEGQFSVLSQDPVLTGSNPCEGEVQYFFDVEDQCGNVHPDSPLEIIFEVDHDNPIVWLGNTDDYLPEDLSFTVSQGECDMGCYFFMDCNWYETPGDPNSESWGPFPLQPNVHFGWDDPNNPCGGDPNFISSHTPCDGPDGQCLMEGVNTVSYTVFHPCDGSVALEYEFEVEIICGNCANGLGLYCDECNEGINCFTCNIQQLLDGFDSCTPPFDGNPSGPTPLCPAGGGGSGEAVSWFRFIAGSPNITVTVTADECIGQGLGIQTGVYDACGGECLAGQTIPCNNVLEADFTFSGLTFGADYYVFVDGCGGSECTYSVTVEGQDGFVLDVPEFVVVNENERPCPEDEQPVEDAFCPGQVIRFDVWHDGSSPPDNGAYDPPGPFDPEASLCFTWDIDPPIDGYSLFTWDQINDGGGYTIPELTMPDVNEPTEFEICILSVEGPCEDPCDVQECDDCCLTITVTPTPPEVCIMDVCIEDLLDPNGFDPSEAWDALCSPSIQGWQGGNISFSDVEDGDTIVVEDLVDPSCNCFYDQKLFVNIIGSNPDDNYEKVPHTFFMFECQFKECELGGPFEQYEWEYNPQTGDSHELNIFDEERCLTLLQLAHATDWDGERCDSIIELTIEPFAVQAQLNPGPCGAGGTPYTWELLLDDVPVEWPEILQNYNIEWVDCDDPDGQNFHATSSSANEPFVVTTATAGEYCIRVDYAFTNLNFPEGSPALTAECCEIFGPYNLTSDQATIPNILGETEFCANDLTSKVFMVDVPAGNSDTYVWNVAATGAVIESQSPNGDMVTLDLTNHDFSQCIVIDANTACGIAQGELCLSTREVPVPSFTISDTICVGENAIANGSSMGGGAIDQWIWTPQPVSGGGQGPVEFTSATPGTQTVMLSVIDVNGCVSDPVEMTYEVIAPLEVPLVSCGTITDSSVEFVWATDPNATGYTVNGTLPGGGVINENLPATQGNYEVTGLGVGESVSITVTVIGNAPCPAVTSSEQMCTTDDCPPTDFSLSESGEACLGDMQAALNWVPTENLASGTFSFTTEPMGAYYDSNTGDINIDGLDVGVYTVRSDYAFGNGCSREGPTFTLTINPLPNPSFLVDDACLGDPIVPDLSSSTGVPSWTFSPDDPTIDANGAFVWATAGDKEVTLTVESTDGCTDMLTQSLTVIDTLINGDITCTAGIVGGEGFVDWDWDDVDGAIEYIVTYDVDGTIETVTVTDSELSIPNVPEGAVVQISIESVPDANHCGTVPLRSVCQADACPDIEFQRDWGPFCWSPADGAINIPLEILDPMTGMMQPGTITWTDNNMDDDGNYTPTIGSNGVNNVTFTFTNQDGCPSSESIRIDILEQPDNSIVDVPTFCINSSGQLELASPLVNDESVEWTWTGGGSASGEGPHDISFTDAGQYEVTAVITNTHQDGTVCENTFTTTFLVDPQLDAPIIDCSSNNTGVTFTWNSVENASEYEILVDGDPRPNQAETNFFISAMPGESFTITVTAISDNTCDNSSETADCTATNCEPSFFNLEPYVESQCLDGTEVSQQLNIELINAPSGAPVVPGAWSGEGVTADGLFNPTGLSAANSIPLNYSVEYDQMCIYDTTIFMTLYEAPSIDNIVPINPDCYQDNQSTVGGLDIQASGGTPPYSYQVPNQNIQNSPAFIEVLNPGSYTATVTDANGCTGELDFEILAAIEPPLGIDGPLSILNSETGEYTISNFPSGPDFMIGDIIWLANDTLILCQGPDCETIVVDDEIIAQFPDGFDLSVQVIFNDDCFQDAEVRIDIQGINKWYIPNVISQSAGSGNDRWVMFTNGGDILVEDLKIYDRWGELVLVKDINSTEREIDLTWEGYWGEDNGKPVEQGVYVYVINMKVAGRNVIEAGDLTILR